MKKELIEKATAIRQSLVALQNQPTDAKTLAEFFQKRSVLRRNYEELRPYMTEDQKERSYWLGGFNTLADIYLQFLEIDPAYPAYPAYSAIKDGLATMVTKHVPQMLADLDDIELKLKQPNEHRTS